MVVFDNQLEEWGRSHATYDGSRCELWEGSFGCLIKLMACDAPAARQLTCSRNRLCVFHPAFHDDIPWLLMYRQATDTIAMADLSSSPMRYTGRKRRTRSTCRQPLFRSVIVLSLGPFKYTKVPVLSSSKRLPQTSSSASKKIGTIRGSREVARTFYTRS